MNMKKIHQIFCSLAVCAIMLGGNTTPACAGDVNIIPVPVKTQVMKGEFVLPQTVTISYQTPEGRNIAQYLADKLKASTGYAVSLGEKKGHISIQITPSLKMADEGYRLTVTSKGVVIKAKTGKGAFYGMQSFMQLLPAQIESPVMVSGVKWAAQCCDITDAPRFGYRGFHLDPCRHFITVENDLNWTDAEWEKSIISNLEQIKIQRKDDGATLRGANNYAAIAEGYINIPEDGVYYLSSRLEQVWIDNKLVVNNEGDVKASTMNDSSVALAKGLHPIKVVFLANIIGGWPSWWSSTAIEMRKDNEKEFTAVGGSQLFR